MCEGFNSAIVHTRSKPIISMLEDIRVYIMKRWAYNRTKLKSRQGSICPKVKNRLDKESWLTRYWIPRSVLISGPHCALSYFFSSLLVHNMFLLQIRWSADKLFEVRHISQLGE